MDREQPPFAENDEGPRIDADRERDYSIARLMAFSDGVFSIAITLLVLNVAVPTITASDAMSRLPTAALKQTAPRLAIFALSFFLVGFYWIRHHELFRSLRDARPWLLWLNLAVLFVICLLPFSSSVIGVYPRTVIGAEVYSTNLALISLAFAALYLYSTRSHLIVMAPNGARGYLGQGLVWPLVVVVLVMILAPLNVGIAYLIGATLMAVVGVYTTVRRAIRSAPLRSWDAGTLRFRRGAGQLRVHVGARRSELFHASFTGPEPRVIVNGNTVELAYRPQFLNWRMPQADIALSSSISWRFEFAAGVVKLEADLTGLRMTGVTFSGGADEVDLRLPRPSGTVPIHIRKGANKVTIRRPDHVPIRVATRVAVQELRFDQEPSGSVVGDAVRESAGYADAVDRYDCEIADGAIEVTIATD